MVLQKNRRPSRRHGNSNIKVFIALVVLIVGGFVAGGLLSSKDDVSRQTATAAVLSAGNVMSGKLRDQENTFEISYPKKLLKRGSVQTTALLSSEDQVKAVNLAHYLPTDCPATECAPTTTDFRLDFYVVDRNFNDVFKDLQKNYGPDLPVVTVDGHQGVAFRLGTEARGSVYTILPVDSAQTLFIERGYVNTESAGSLTLEEQKALFDQIMGTFSFRPSI